MDARHGMRASRGEGRRIPFTKLHGNGNDFILIDEYGGEVIPEELKADFAAAYCERRFGIGADGVLFLSKVQNADIGMRLFQQDRSEASMCGNGIRCLVKYAFDRGYVQSPCRVETKAGVIPVIMGYEGGIFMATVRMPAPAFEPSKIPALCDGSEYCAHIEGLVVYAVNTGVPHAIVPVEDIESVDLARIGPKIRFHISFPEGANVNLMQRIDGSTIKIRTYERGVEAETLSCGTGATAAAAVAHRLGFVGSDVEVLTKGGPLWIELGETTKMKGPAETVFYGYVPVA